MTRTIVQFTSENKVEAQIYVHNGGEPTSMASLLSEFFSAASLVYDRRFDDPTYLAAKFVVWFATEKSHCGGSPLNFVGIGVYMTIPEDVRYVYKLDCDSDRKRPGVTAYESKNGKVGKIVPMPLLVEV